MEPSNDNADTVWTAGAGRTKAIIIYVLYFFGFLWILPTIAGVIMAYTSKANAPSEWQSHFRFQIWTFWINAAVVLLFAYAVFWSGAGGDVAAEASNRAAVWTRAAILFGLGIVWVVWNLFRIIRGFGFAMDGRAHPQPATLLW